MRLTMLSGSAMAAGRHCGRPAHLPFVAARATHLERINAAASRQRKVKQSRAVDLINCMKPYSNRSRQARSSAPTLAANQRDHRHRDPGHGRRLACVNRPLSAIPCNFYAPVRNRARIEQLFADDLQVGRFASLSRAHVARTLFSARMCRPVARRCTIPSVERGSHQDSPCQPWPQKRFATVSTTHCSKTISGILSR